jgi:uncharacterized protein YkwD
MPRFAAHARVALLLALFVLVGSVGAVGTPVSVIARDGVDRDAASEALLTRLTNDSRAAAGLAALDVDPDLVSLARWRSADMAERDYFSHAIPPKGTKVFDEMAARDYCSVVAGENIGWLAGPGGGGEERIQQMFLDSPKHRAVLLGDAWNAIGIGSFTRADGRHYWTVLFAETCPTAG